MTYLKELVAKNLILRDGDGGKTSPDAKAPADVKAPAEASEGKAPAEASEGKAPAEASEGKAPADDTKALASANDQSPQQNQPGLDPKALANLMGGGNGGVGQNQSGRNNTKEGGNKKSKMAMIGAGVIGGFLVFGPIGAIIGGLMAMVASNTLDKKSNQVQSSPSSGGGISIDPKALEGILEGLQKPNQAENNQASEKTGEGKETKGEGKETKGESKDTKGEGKETKGESKDTNGIEALSTTQRLELNEITSKLSGASYETKAGSAAPPQKSASISYGR